MKAVAYLKLFLQNCVPSQPFNVFELPSDMAPGAKVMGLEKLSNNLKFG